jgi:hypothetical protein
MISLLIALAPITAAFACNVGTTVSPEVHRHPDVQQFVIGSRPITSENNSHWSGFKQFN